jgi:hypothetical protein
MQRQAFPLVGCCGFTSNLAHKTQEHAERLRSGQRAVHCRWKCFMYKLGEAKLLVRRVRGADGARRGPWGCGPSGCQAHLIIVYLCFDFQTCHSRSALAQPRPSAPRIDGMTVREMLCPRSSRGLQRCGVRPVSAQDLVVAFSCFSARSCLVSYAYLSCIRFKI